MFFFFFPFETRLNTLLKVYNLTPTEFCKITDTNNSLFYRYLKGENVPRNKNINYIANKLNISNDWLSGRAVDIQENAIIRIDNESTAHQDSDEIISHISLWKPVMRCRVPFEEIDHSVIQKLIKLMATELRLNETQEDLYFDIIKKLSLKNELGLLKLLNFIDNDLKDSKYNLNESELNLLTSNDLNDYTNFIYLNKIINDYPMSKEE